MPTKKPPLQGESQSSPAGLSLFAENPEKYPGIYFNNPDDGTVIQTTPRSSDEKALDHLPIPDRDDYDHLQYQQFWRDREEVPLAGIMTSYGCPFDCDFCSKPVFGNRLRRRGMDRIFAEIRDIKDRGYTGLWIADDCFSLDPTHVRCFCRRLLSEKLDMKWFCLSRVDGITHSDIELWQASGCRKVFFGLESGSNDILKIMNKKTTTGEAEKTIQRFAQSDIRTAGFFIVGYPGETYDTIETTFKWALSLPLDETAIENPGLPLGFNLSLPENVSPPCVQIAAGREVGRDLNWAGLSLATDQAVFTYHVNIYTQKRP